MNKNQRADQGAFWDVDWGGLKPKDHVLGWEPLQGMGQFLGHFRM